MPTPAFESIPSVAEVSCLRGREAPADAAPDLLLEVPHGATRGAHFDDLLAELRGPFPDDLRSFFFVNTDVGAPEVADALARRVVEEAPGRSVLVVRCVIPRTFVDCNRQIAPDAEPRASAAGEVTPGLAPYARDPEDQRLLLGRYRAYRDLVSRAVDRVCGAGGTALFLHSYAPREVDVPVDDRIVEHLRRAYAPDTVTTWPLRPEVDFIVRTPEGVLLASPSLVASLEGAFAADRLETAEGRTYPLHPATMAFAFAARHPAHTLCLEMRRDLLVPTFRPFVELIPDPSKVERMAAAMTRALCAWWSTG